MHTGLFTTNSKLQCHYFSDLHGMYSCCLVHFNSTMQVQCDQHCGYSRASDNEGVSA